MAGLRSDLEDDVERFTDLLGWADNALTLLGALVVILLAMAWCLR